MIYEIIPGFFSPQMWSFTIIWKTLFTSWYFVKESSVRLYTTAAMFSVYYLLLGLPNFFDPQQKQLLLIYSLNTELLPHLVNIYTKLYIVKTAGVLKIWKKT